MGLDHAMWVRADEACQAPLFQKSVCVDDPTGATIDICGLGFFELYINGKKVSDELFVPSCSDYGYRDLTRAYYPIHDTVRHIVYYKTYDLSAYLRRGDNTVEILLGNGWYRQTERCGEGPLSFGIPCLVFSMKIDGKEIVSDESLSWTDSHITFNNIYFGERQDHTRKIGMAKAAIRAKAPDGALARDTAPADKVIRTLTPKRIRTENGVTLYDAGENISGYVTFRGGEYGEEISLRFAECLSEDGSLNTKTGGNPQQESYICDGSDRVYHPHFCYHGFRYFEIGANTRDVTVAVVHSDIALTASFSSDNRVLNFLFDATVRSLYSNMHGGVISDCPHRERLGYTGDGQLTADVALMIMDAESFYEKWMLDIALSQDLTTGHVQHTAPFMGGGGGPGGWGGAVVIVPYMLWRHSGKREILERYYPNMCLWVRYMESRSEGGLVVREEEKGWCLGDWCTVGRVELPPEFVNTYFLAKNLERMAEIAEVIGRESELWREKARRLKDALTENFYDGETHHYCGGVQGADAFAADLGLADRRMLDALARRYEELGRFDTGIFGTDILIRILFENGYADTALTLLTSEKQYSFGEQLLCGETTLREHWDDKNASLNHHMFGACTAYLFRYLLGIHTEEGVLRVDPVPYTMPLSVKGELRTRFATVRVERDEKTWRSEIVCDKLT